MTYLFLGKIFILDNQHNTVNNPTNYNTNAG